MSVVLLEARGLPFTEVAPLDAVFFGTIALAELPTGYVGDRVGRRNAPVASSFVVAASAVGFGFARGLVEFPVVSVLSGVAVTFRSATTAPRPTTRSPGSTIRSTIGVRRPGTGKIRDRTA